MNNNVTNRMDRRSFNRLTLAFGLSVALVGVVHGADRQLGKPNILLIITDQQHARMMSCAGNKHLKTLAMDSLATEGVRFERAYCANPVCAPSRTSMATGVMSCRLGAADNGSGLRIKAIPSEVDGNSLGKLMKRAGYATFYGGKVHMCDALKPEQAGYDEYFRDEREELPAACLKFIGKRGAKPFFAVASFINPHDICFADEALKGEGHGDALELYKKAAALPLAELTPLPDNYAIQENEPAAICPYIKRKRGTRVRAKRNESTPVGAMREEFTERDWRIYRWIYHRLTEKVDGHIGQILAGLKSAGVEDNTVIIFTSDHGNMDASHRLASKAQFYEESVGVPFIVKDKGGVKAGQVDRSHLVSTGLDILPTICDYAGIEKPRHLLGMSVRPLVEGRNVENWREYIASENHNTRMIRTDRYKYCAFADADSREMLVDLEKDPGEMRNLADDPASRDVLARHRRFLAEWSMISGDKDASKYLMDQPVTYPKK